MQYISLTENPYYGQCAPLVESLGFILVELLVNKRRDDWQVRLVIAKKAETTEDTGGVGINDCSKVHRLLQPRLEAVLQSQDIYMEVTSPGLERLIKNAAEFELFVHRGVRVWSSVVTEWIYGVVIAADRSKLSLCRNDDGSVIDIPYEDIAKAKLDYSREVEK